MSQRAHYWLHRIMGSATVKAVCERVRAQNQAIVEGASGSAATLIAGCLAQTLHRTVLLAVAHLDDCDDAAEDLNLFDLAGMGLNVRRFPALEVVPGESTVSVEMLAERLGLVENLATGRLQREENPTVIVAPIQALMQSVPQPSQLKQFQIRIHEGSDVSPAMLLDWLDRAGYSRTDAIEQPGEFATRGGIIDIYLPSSVVEIDQLPGAKGKGKAEPKGGTQTTGPLPIRLDYFGDEVESIYEIDTGSMGSVRRLRSAQVVGATAPQLQSDDETTTLLSLLPDNTLNVITEVLEMAEQARGYYERLTNPRGIYAPNATLQQLTKAACVQINQFGMGGGPNTIKLPIRPLHDFDHDASKAVEQLDELEGDIVVTGQNDGEISRLNELISELVPGIQSRTTLEPGYLHRGFVWDFAEEAHAYKLPGDEAAPMHLVPHHELFHRYETRRRIRRIGAAGTRSSDAFLDLAPGDFVVHIEHGIAKYVSMRTMKRDGQSEDFLTLQFANKAILHVPLAQIDQVQKYIGGFQGAPPLSVLGGKRWDKQKQQVAEAVKDLAKQMLQIQAARAAMPGIRYPADTTWQHEFEAEFPYEETEDQLAAITSIKKDMTGDRPMDRLLCGDVGFGKTEVAIRAAFKAAEFGKQVAVLVPTTVLAEQHERTFRSRMVDYPFKVESLSRFKGSVQTRAILERVKRGQVDIVIGTHRLLSKDVKFADLGLVIIDEEQKFGVEHKQRLLEFRLTADVLTMTATPIPRTLHMSMLGLRDISSLTTPPLDRRAIVTEVTPFDERRIAQAINRELNRDGQIYFVHNRVHDIHAVASRIKVLAPSARIVVGHGQMQGHQLEEVMLKFIRREADILVSTTIIESGIDIATANTMFINQADIFGLAELHQLRGRVGRYKHRAYCYLLLPEERPLSDQAAKRLKSIEQYSMLGAGFKIAMRDLEIRGAGNLLGPEQSGHIAAVGYEMYCRMLEHEAKRLRNEPIVEPTRTQFDLPVAGRIPQTFIQNERYRMDAYRRLSRAQDLEELDAVVKDLTDAYGKAPEAAQRLYDLAELRIAAHLLDVELLKLDGPDLIFITNKPMELEPLLRDAPGRVTLIDKRTIYYRPPANYLQPAETMLAVLRKLLVRPLRERANAIAKSAR